MTYPVQPPEPPAIVYHVSSQGAAVPALSFDEDLATARNEAPLEASIVVADGLGEALSGHTQTEEIEAEITVEPNPEVSEFPPETEVVQLETLETVSGDPVADTKAIAPLHSFAEPDAEVWEQPIETLETSRFERLETAEAIAQPQQDESETVCETLCEREIDPSASVEPPESLDVGESETIARLQSEPEPIDRFLPTSPQTPPAASQPPANAVAAIEDVSSAADVFQPRLPAPQALLPARSRAQVDRTGETLQTPDSSPNPRSRQTLSVGESRAQVDRPGETLQTPDSSPNPRSTPTAVRADRSPTTEIPAVGTLGQFSRDSQLLNAQPLHAQTPIATPAFDWAVMPSGPNPDTSFRLPVQFIAPPTDGVALQPSPRVNPPVEVTADLQQFEEQRRVFTAQGNVVLRYQGTVVDADWLQVNLRSRQGIGEGNVALTQIDRVLRGDRFRYNFAQDSGTVYGVRGEVNTATAPTRAQTLPSDVSAGGQPRLLSDRLLAAQPVEVVPGAGGFVGTVGAGRGNNPSGTTGTLSRLRFEADEVNFYPRGWQGRGVRITNDPFGPEIEVRADSATLTRLSPLQDELVLSNPRLVFDDGFALPLLRRRYRIDRRERDPALIQFGFDRRDRGGFYIFRDFEVLSRRGFRLTLTPQYYIQRGFDRGSLVSLREFGLITKLEADFTPNTSLTAIASFTNLDPETFDPDGNPFQEDDGDLRSSVRLAQIIPTRLGLHTLSAEYSYRDRLFNGSLGFRTVHQTAGVILTSPNILLGKSGVNLSYQAGYNWVEADTDRIDLLEIIRDSNRINMGRFQSSVALNKGIFLWRGEPLPATPTEGLRFSPIPVVPFVQVFFGARGIGNFYTRSDPALGLTGTVGLQGQFGHFAKKFLDYSAFSISYSGTLRQGQSPFLFDRLADRSILGLSFTQQLYGPLRVGIATAINLEEGDAFSTDYTLEYSRRSYGLILRFNPQRELGSFTLRISDFNWQGGTEPFTPIDGSVRRD